MKSYNQKQTKTAPEFINKPLSCQSQELVTVSLTTLSLDLFQTCDAWVPQKSQVVSKLLFSTDVTEQ